jgi:hypothetical protein
MVTRRRVWANWQSRNYLIRRESVKKTVSTLLVVAVCAAILGLPATAKADEMKVANRWALGLNANPFAGFAPTVEYWTSENLGLSASFSWYYWWSTIGLRGTYLFDTPIQILSMPARPYAGAGLGFLTYNAYLEYSRYSNVGLEVFGGLFQPLSAQLSLRAELQASSYGLTGRAGYHSFSPLSVGVGIFYHF